MCSAAGAVAPPPARTMTAVAAAVSDTMYSRKSRKRVSDSETENSMYLDGTRQTIRRR